MEQIIFKPALYKYSTCKEFAESFSLSERDLILTNEYIYAPYFGKLALPCHVVYQEKYGLGEPSDVMAEAILKDIGGLTFDRIIAIGGGTIIDLAKVFAVADTMDMDELKDFLFHRYPKNNTFPISCNFKRSAEPNPKVLWGLFI